jgi:hypothetical protein
VDQPPLDNRTEFKVHPQILVDKDGEKLVCVVKATFHLPSLAGGTPELAPKKLQRGIRTKDVPWGKPEISSVAYPADLCVRKPGTDVVFVARAFAPGGKAVPTFDVHVQVGPLRKTVRVFGLRVWHVGGSGLSPPRPIAQCDMRYDYAWGGFDGSDEAHPVEEARNPVGMGIARDSSALTDKPAPNLEDPMNPIASSKTRPPPAGIGAIGRHWEPRRKYVGTYDKSWLEHRAPLPPDDQDDRFNQCASTGLVAEQPLIGGEQVALLNLIPDGGPTAFPLPRVAVEIEFRVKDREPFFVKPHLDTVLVDLLDVGPTEPIAVELVWRASTKAPRRLKDSRTIVREIGWGL